MTTISPGPRTRRRWIRIVIAVVLIAVVIVGGLATVPVAHSFDGTFSLPRLHVGDYVLHTPEGGVVTGAWSEAGGGRVDFLIVDSSDYPIYQTNGTGGFFSFPVDSATYGFEGLTTANVTDTVAVSGVCSSPIL